jgi:hypothetical protein
MSRRITQGSQTIPVVRRRYVAISLAIIIGLIVGVVVVYPYLTANSNPLAGNKFLTKGNVTYFAFGGEVSVPVALSKSYRLTGGFDTNTSLIFYVMTSQAYDNQINSPIAYYYSTGNVKTALINTTIVSGNYDLVFDFVNSTGRTVTSSNGTGLVSTTALTITQTFVLSPL